MGHAVATGFASCNCAHSVVARLKAIVLSLGFDAVAVVDMQDAAPVRTTGGADGTAQGYQVCIPLDTACQVARRRIAPFLWPDLHLGREAAGSFKLLSLAIPDLDPACVGTVPVHGPNGSANCLHVAARSSSDAFAELFHRSAHTLQALAIDAVQRLIELGLDETIGTRLTERQQDVLHWVVEGKTNWEIGQILGISPDTVRQHVMHIAGALKVRNRVQVAAIAVARGICAPSAASLIPPSELN